VGIICVVADAVYEAEIAILSVRNEFLEVTFYKFPETQQADLDKWLIHYNPVHPHLGYRNTGKRLIDTIREFRESVSKDA
jgi:hypothetical protein